MFNKREATTPAPPSTPARRFTDGSGDVDTVFGAGLQLKGEVKGKTNLELRGHLDGTCEIEGLFIIRRKGKLVGQVTATNVVVEGELEGTITASQKVELRPSGRITGDIRAASVAVAEGSFFEGKIQMTGAAPAPSSAHLSFQEKRSEPVPSPDSKEVAAKNAGS